MKGIILAGGSGSRLWPLSRRNFPKQFLRFGDESSFLQKTIQRNLEVLEEVYIITSRIYFQEVCQQIKEIDKDLDSNIILEPDKKNTGPAIAYAMQNIKDGDLFLVTPSDHIISPVNKYKEAIVMAENYARQGYLVTFGVIPTRPETGYGYLKTKEHLVEKFVEKPDLKTAKAYLENGNYFWNSGMFLFSKKTFEEEAEKYCPSLIKKDFVSMPNISLDYAIMEKSKKVAMVPLQCSWSDIGSWENVYEIMGKDKDQNVTRGSTVTINTKNSLIFAGKRTVATIDLDNMVIVETADSILVAPKESSQKVKELVDQLVKQNKQEAHDHLTVNRPWGKYTVLQESPRYKIKQIVVQQKQKLSLQMHYHRSEHWVIVAGTAKVTIGDEQKILKEGDSIFVPKAAIHRLENPGKVALHLIEVQVGEYLGEDDIIRFEDVYDRLELVN